ALAVHYEIEREMGRGGMGIVYRARDLRLKRPVAVKLLPPELAFRGDIRSRFLREAETAAGLSHPNIVPIYSVDEREGLVYFVMALVDGPTLAKRLHDEHQMGIEDTRRILREVADALAYAHARGVVHRDIKPDNILLDKDTGRAMVTDFGIARAVQESGDSRLTATGVAIGTPAYMSPEQAAGDREIDGRSDLYSLGVVGYQMLAGELPFNASSTPAMLIKHLSDAPPPLESKRASIPSDIASAVMTLLEKDPSRRFPDAARLSLALQGDPAGTRWMAERPPRASLAPGAAWQPAAVGQGSGMRAAADPLRSPYPDPDAALEPGTITPDDIARWSAPQVQKFRGQFATYAWVNAVVLASSMTFLDRDFAIITLFWSMAMAARYAKLWSSNYDWRDVFRQPRDRRLLDVASETVEDVRGAFGKTRNDLGRQRDSRRQRMIAAASAMAPSAAVGALDPTPRGRHAPTVLQAQHFRNDINQLMDSLPKSDRDLVRDVIPAADGLLQRIRSLAATLDDLERSAPPAAGEQLEAQITELESQANPLQREASEERVRRLALLKRQRRALAEGDRRKEQAASKLESCVLALQNMRYDVMRLRAGGVSANSGQITVLTERARNLADEVDAALIVANESRRGGAARGEQRSP
ncbi:MAG: protein kinase, partial [Gemmatimonadota bacterium]|nr:protein kinase [Gemmatimonadota bacterium]